MTILCYNDWFDSIGNELTDDDGEYLSDEAMEEEYEDYVSCAEEYMIEQHEDDRLWND